MWPFVSTKRVLDVLSHQGCKGVKKAFGNRASRALSVIAIMNDLDIGVRESAISALVSLEKFNLVFKKIDRLPDELVSFAFRESFASLIIWDIEKHVLRYLISPNKKVKRICQEEIRKSNKAASILFAGTNRGETAEIKNACRSLLEDVGEKADIYFVRVCLMEPSIGQPKTPVMDEPRDKDMFVLGAIADHGYTLSGRSKVDFRVLPLPPTLQKDIFILGDSTKFDEERSKWFEINALCVGAQTQKMLAAQGVFGALYLSI